MHAVRVDSPSTWIDDPEPETFLKVSFTCFYDGVKTAQESACRCMHAVQVGSPSLWTGDQQSEMLLQVGSAGCACACSPAGTVGLQQLLVLWSYTQMGATEHSGKHSSCFACSMRCYHSPLATCLAPLVDLHHAAGHAGLQGLPSAATHHCFLPLTVCALSLLSVLQEVLACNDPPPSPCQPLCVPCLYVNLPTCRTCCLTRALSAAAVPCHGRHGVLRHSFWPLPLAFAHRQHVMFAGGAACRGSRAGTLNTISS